MRYILICLTLLFSTSALADWDTHPDDAGNTVRFLMPAGEGGPYKAYFDFTNSTDNSPLLDVFLCDVVDLFFDPDEDGTNTGAEIQVYIQHEGSGGDAAPSNANASHKVLNGAGDVTLTGDEVTGRASIVGIPGSGMLWIDSTVADADDSRVWVVCHD